MGPEPAEARTGPTHEWHPGGRAGRGSVCLALSSLIIPVPEAALDRVRRVLPEAGYTRWLNTVRPRCPPRANHARTPITAREPHAGEVRNSHRLQGSCFEIADAAQPHRGSKNGQRESPVRRPFFRVHIYDSEHDRAKARTSSVLGAFGTTGSTCRRDDERRRPAYQILYLAVAARAAMVLAKGGRSPWVDALTDAGIERQSPEQSDARCGRVASLSHSDRQPLAVQGSRESLT